MSDDLLVAPGTLLAAWPDLLDPNFMHGVLVVCQHSPEGAYGLVLNRATELTLGELLPEHADLAESDLPVRLGGPVDHSSMQFLHRVPADIHGGVELAPGLWLGGDLEHLGRLVSQTPDRARANVAVFLGYSGWGVEQLEAELATGSWLPAPLDLDAIFGEPDEDLWKRVVRTARPEGADLENLPPDVNWN